MKILLISLGSIGQRHFNNLKKLAPHSKIKILRLKKKFENKKNILENFYQAKKFDPDLIIINSPANYHFKLFKKFFSKKRSFFIEKPLDSNLSNLDKNFKKYKKNKFSMVGYILRFDKVLNKVKEIVKKRKYGSVLHANISAGQYLPYWRTNKKYQYGVSAQKKLGGGVLLELSHEIDYAKWIFGKPNKVFCVAKKISNLKINVEDIASIIFEYEKKVVQISLDFLQRTPKLDMKVVFEKATIYCNLIKQEIKIFNETFPKGKNIPIKKFKNGNEIYLHQMDFLLNKSFKNYNLKFKENKNFKNFSTINESKEILEIIEKLKKSSVKGSKLKI